MAHTNGTTHDVAAALDRALIIPNECNANIPPENVVDGLLAIARALVEVAKAIESQATETSGVHHALGYICDPLRNIAEAIAEHKTEKVGA